MTETTKKRFKLKKKPAPKPSQALTRIRKNPGQPTDEFNENLTGVVKARHESVLNAKEAEVESTTALARSNREVMSTKYHDENGDLITPEQMRLLQDTVSSFYENFVVLTDSQIKDLQSKLPKEINNNKVKVGHKAVFPPILDTERKKVSRGRVVQKAYRLKYIESDDQRGLKMPEDVETLLTEKRKSKRYLEARQAKKDLVRTLIALNYNDYEMIEYLQVPSKELAKLKKEIYFEELTIHRQMTNEELFVQYKLQQMEVIKDLDVIIERFKGSKQLTALAAAMRTKSDIYNEIINKGYEFGVIEKTPDKSAVIVGNINVANATLDDMKSQLVKTNKEIEKIVKSDDFLNKPEETIDVDVEED
jgi:hypothetical protein